MPAQHELERRERGPVGTQRPIQRVPSARSHRPFAPEIQAVRGVDLTLEGLKRPNPQHDIAAGLSNLCAGYVGLRQFELAIKNCSDSLAINDSNWRTWNNRAAAHLGKGMYDAALQDVESGLERAPESFTLKKTRAIVLERQRAREQLQRDALRT